MLKKPAMSEFRHEWSLQISSLLYISEIFSYLSINQNSLCTKKKDSITYIYFYYHCSKVTDRCLFLNQDQMGIKVLYGDASIQEGASTESFPE